MTWQVGDIAVDGCHHRYEVTSVDDGVVWCREIPERSCYDDTTRRFRPYDGEVHPMWTKEEVTA